MRRRSRDRSGERTGRTGGRQRWRLSGRDADVLPHADIRGQTVEREPNAPATAIVATRPVSQRSNQIPPAPHITTKGTPPSLIHSCVSSAQITTDHLLPPGTRRPTNRALPPRPVAHPHRPYLDRHYHGRQTNFGEVILDTAPGARPSGRFSVQADLAKRMARQLVDEKAA